MSSAITDFAGEIIEQARIVFQKPVWVFTAVAVVLIAMAIGVWWYRRQAHIAEYIAQVESQPSPILSSGFGLTNSNRQQENTTGRQGPSATTTPAPRLNDKSKPRNEAEEGTRSLPGEAAAELAAVKRIYMLSESI